MSLSLSLSHSHILSSRTWFRHVLIAYASNKRQGMSNGRSLRAKELQKAINQRGRESLHDSYGQKKDYCCLSIIEEEDMYIEQKSVKIYRIEVTDHCLN